MGMTITQCIVTGDTVALNDRFPLAGEPCRTPLGPVVQEAYTAELVDTHPKIADAEGLTAFVRAYRDKGGDLESLPTGRALQRRVQGIHDAGLRLKDSAPGDSADPSF